MKGFVVQVAIEGTETYLIYADGPEEAMKIFNDGQGGLDPVKSEVLNAEAVSAYDEETETWTYA